MNTERNALKQWKEQYGWAETVNRDQFQQLASVAQRMQSDPVAFLQEFAAELQAHPEHGAKLRSFAARALAQGRGQQAPADAMPQPDVQITDGNGTVVGQTYSAEQLAKRDAFLRQQMLAEIRQEFQPVVETVGQVTAERAKLQADSYATSTFAELSKLPGFTEHKVEIGQRLKAMNLNTDDPHILTLAVKAIYADVVTPKREQELSSKAQSQLLDNLHQKAAASTSVNPGSAAPSAPRQVHRFDDPSLVWR